MPKRLSGSAGTGREIMQNLNIFDYSYESQKSKEADAHVFSWSFGNQAGTATIILKDDGVIDSTSMLQCNRHDGEDGFCRPLGVYNDDTLNPVFTMMLDHEKIKHK